MALWNCCHITKITNLPEQILISYELGFPISKIKFSSIFMQTIPICETAFISETQTYFPFISIYNMFLQQYFRQLIGFSAYVSIHLNFWCRKTGGYRTQVSVCTVTEDILRNTWRKLEYRLLSLKKSENNSTWANFNSFT